MKHLAALFLFLLALQAPAQAFYELDYQETARSFGEGVRVRKSPDLHAPVLGKLALGEEVQVLAYTTDEEHITHMDGINLPWVKVRTASGLKGYVWSALLAHADFQGPLPGMPDEGLLLIGLVERGEKLHPTMRMVRDGKLVKELALPAQLQLPSHEWMDGEFFDLVVEVHRPEGFDGGLTLLMFGEGSCACACHSTDDWYLWDGSKFDQLVFSLGHSENVGYANSDFSSYEVIFPKDEGGQPNRLQTRDRAGIYLDEDNGPYTLTTTWVTYELRDGQLVEVERTEHVEGMPGEKAE